jgi:hypothetical protein
MKTTSQNASHTDTYQRSQNPNPNAPGRQEETEQRRTTDPEKNDPTRPAVTEPEKNDPTRREDRPETPTAPGKQETQAQSNTDETYDEIEEDDDLIENNKTQNPNQEERDRQQQFK